MDIISHILIGKIISLFIDIFTHTGGEWAMKPFYPFNFYFNGFTDVWAWPFYLMAVLWVVLLVILFFLKKTMWHRS